MATTYKIAYYWVEGHNIDYLSTANSAVLVTNGSGVPSLSTTLPAGVTFGGVAITQGYTVAGLPAAGAGLKGARAHVTDALAPAFLTVVVGGGTVVTPVFCNGTAWVGG